MSKPDAALLARIEVLEAEAADIGRVRDENARLKKKVAEVNYQRSNLKAELHRQRLVIQSHDCGYGETGPGLIFSPIDKPCTKHRLARAEEEIERLTNKGSE